MRLRRWVCPDDGFASLRHGDYVTGMGLIIFIERRAGFVCAERRPWWQVPWLTLTTFLRRRARKAAAQ